MRRFQKSIRKSDKYKYVYLRQMDSGDLMWAAQMESTRISYHKDERKAAMAVDMYRISIGKEPINILVRKTPVM